MTSEQNRADAMQRECDRLRASLARLLEYAERYADLSDAPTDSDVRKACDEAKSLTVY